MPPGIIPPGIGVSLGIIPPGIGMPLGFGAAGGGGLSGWGAEAVTGCSVNIPEDPAQVPAKKVATAIHAEAKTAAIRRLRSRRSLPNSSKNPIVDSSRSGVKRRLPNQMTSRGGTSLVLLFSYVDPRRDLRAPATRALRRLRTADRLGAERPPLARTSCRCGLLSWYVDARKSARPICRSINPRRPSQAALG